MWQWLINIWNWIKRNTKKVLVGTGVVGIAVAGTVMMQDEVPEDLKLKGEVISYEHVGDDVHYKYKGDKVKKMKFKDKDEKEEKRTSNSRFYLDKKEGKTETWIQISYVGEPFYKDIDGEWYETGFGTTTKDAYKKEKDKDLGILDWFLGQALADSTTTYAGSGDGRVTRSEEANWADAQGNADGSDVSAVNTNYEGTRAWHNNNATWRIDRAFFPIYTIIDENAVISSSTFYIYLEASSDNDNDSEAYVAIVETSQPDHTTLATADYDLCGDAIDDPTIGGGLYDDGNGVSTGTDITTVVTSSYNAFELNATGLTWIKREGETSTCGTDSSLTGWTCLGLREGHDIEDDTIVGANGTGNHVDIRYEEFTGTASDPYLVIVYTIVVNTCTCTAEQDWVVDSDDNCFLDTECNIAGKVLYLMDTGKNVDGNGGLHLTSNARLIVGSIQTTSTEFSIETGGELHFSP